MIILTHSDLTMLENNELFVDSDISTNFTAVFFLCSINVYPCGNLLATPSLLILFLTKCNIERLQKWIYLCTPIHQCFFCISVEVVGWFIILKNNYKSKLMIKNQNITCSLILIITPDVDEQPYLTKESLK